MTTQPDPTTVHLEPLTGRDVHREWRDGMLAQGRHVAPERMAWETLSEEDRLLDDGIAERLAARQPASPDLRARVIAAAADHGVYENNSPAFRDILAALGEPHE